MRRNARAWTAVLATALLALAACRGGGGSTAAGSGGAPPPDIPKLAALGAGEGAVTIVARAGYVEDGSNDPTVDWVHDFEKETGCKVTSKVAGTSDEMVSLLKTGGYDVVSAAGDVSLRLIYGGDVAPVNTTLVPNYADIFDGLKNRRWNSVNGVPYGIPHGRAANLLMYRTDVVRPAPTSWAAVFDPNSPYKGNLTAYDSPMSLADAALYLMKSQPALGIKNPYALDDKQFQAAVALLEAQRKNVGEYWSDYSKEVQAFKAGTSVLGTTWQVTTNLARADRAPVQAVLPAEGATGWSDTWMISAKAKHPNCAYLWMNHIVSPGANAAVAEWSGQAPANKLACQHTTDKNFCTAFHADDQAYFAKIWSWTTPIARCLDGRTNVTCKDYAAWTQAWTEIKG